MRAVVLAIDAGGTHTRAIIQSDAGAIGTGLAGPANWTSLGPASCLEQISRAVSMALSVARLRVDDLSHACLAMAGYYPAWHEAAVRTALAELMPGVETRVVPDLIAGWAGATGGRAGIVLMAGTGAVAYGQDAGGRTARAGGWGPLFGDEGGGYWIGCEVLRAVSRSLDGRRPSTSLVEAIRRASAEECRAACPEGTALGLQERTDEEALRGVYRDGWSRQKVADLAVDAARHAAAGDPVAEEILERAAGELGALIAVVGRRLDWHAEPLPLVAVGGVTNAGPVLLHPLRRWISTVLPHGRWQEPLGSPLDGALLLARGKEPR